MSGCPSSHALLPHVRVLFYIRFADRRAAHKAPTVSSHILIPSFLKASCISHFFCVWPALPEHLVVCSHVFVHCVHLTSSITVCLSFFIVNACLRVTDTMTSGRTSSRLTSVTDQRGSVISRWTLTKQRAFAGRSEDALGGASRYGTCMSVFTSNDFEQCSYSRKIRRGGIGGCLVDIV